MKRKIAEQIALGNAGQERLKHRIRLAMVEAAKCDAGFVMLPGDLVGCVEAGREKFANVVRLNGDRLILDDGTAEYEVPRVSCYFPATAETIVVEMAIKDVVADQQGRN